MIVFPNCKINLGFNILRKRADGFHDLETVFYPVFFRDVLEIVVSKNGSTTITVSGKAAGNDDDNLCMKAYHLLKKDHPEIQRLDIFLHKEIPSGAGFGGGSADAAFMIQLICKKFDLNISEKEKLEYASKLGSDCAFFLYNKPCLATSRGEALQPINISLLNYKIILVHPDIHISTSEAFKNITPVFPQKRIQKIIQQPIETWKYDLTNDFEKFVFEKYILVKKIKEDFYNAGAVYAALSGSGSTVFGIFKKEAAINYNTSMFNKIISAV